MNLKVLKLFSVLSFTAIVGTFSAFAQENPHCKLPDLNDLSLADASTSFEPWVDEYIVRAQPYVLEQTRHLMRTQACDDAEKLIKTVVDKLLKSSSLEAVANQSTPSFVIHFICGQTLREGVLKPTASLSMNVLRMDIPMFNLTANEDELASVLSHELVHFFHKHVQNFLACSGEELIKSGQQPEMTPVLREKFKQLNELNFNVELQSDRLALELLKNASYNTHSSIDILQKFINYSAEIQPSNISQQKFLLKRKEALELILKNYNAQPIHENSDLLKIQNALKVEAQ